jgi:hypothetical protein
VVEEEENGGFGFSGESGTPKYSDEIARALTEFVPP